MIQRSWGNLPTKFWGKGIRPSKLGDTVDRGAVNRGFTVTLISDNNHDLATPGCSQSKLLGVTPGHCCRDKVEPSSGL
jgi:hypothetical protein